MSNTIMTAKNSFSEGLIMDFAPDNTQATTLTSALNATLLTFNGNEMSLQNDMGNGRVETAYLPEGYVPVGTCEFGDIIYIVSYNPLINKSLIGCFPSPERNISSQEIGGTKLSIKSSDFLVFDKNGPTGELVSLSVKKVLYDSRDMTSGDKYIIYSDLLEENSKFLSDYGNTSHQHNRFPKFVKIHVVSIEESGKITYLDSSTKWYKENNFYMLNQKEILDKPDIDSYRTMTSSAYSVFSSKVSGKLALLIELEKISGFSCTWSAYTQEKEFYTEGIIGANILENIYSIYWNFNWATLNFNINPSAIVLTKSEWTGENSTYKGYYRLWDYVEENKAYTLGGRNNKWIEGINISKAYPESNYYYSDVTRLYSPEFYKGTFTEFIETDSYYVKSLVDLNALDIRKKTIDLKPNIELTKVSLAIGKNDDDDDLVLIRPKLGNYYFNCDSTITKGNITKYYTNWDNKALEIQDVAVSDDIINNTFSYPITKKFTDFIIPVKLKITQDNKEYIKDVDISNLIYHYELTPAMPYGLLRLFSQTGYIDFKKIGTKSIKVDTWKYYNYENTSTLTWGLEAYTEPNKGISEVVFLFYDNQGVCAAYHSTGKSSYNGKFTEYFTLNTSGTNYKLTNRNEKLGIFYHRGTVINKESVVADGIYLDINNKVIPISDMKDGEEYYVNDAGTLYSNCLYLVKTIVKYCSIGNLGEYIEDSYVEDYRWYWTNVIFNEYYYSVLDFKDLLFSLNMDCLAVFETVKEKWEIKKADYKAKNNYNEAVTNSNAFKSLSATVLYINLNKLQDSNIRMAVRAGLHKNYNTFNLDKDKLYNIKARVFLAEDSIKNYPELPKVIFTEEDTVIFPGINPTNATNLTGQLDKTTSYALNSLVGSTIAGTGKEIYAEENSYENYTNNFRLTTTMKESEKKGNYNGSLVYIDSATGEEKTTSSFTEHASDLSKIGFKEDTQKIDPRDNFFLTFSGIHYSKYYYNSKASNVPVRKLKAFVSKKEDLTSYALGINSSNKVQYTKMVLCSSWVHTGKDDGYTFAIASFNNNYLTNKIYDRHRAWKDGDSPVRIPVDEMFSDNSSAVADEFKFLYPQGFGHIDLGGKKGGENWTKAKLDDRVDISDNKEVLVSEYNTHDLGGTLVGLTTSNISIPGDHMARHNVLTAFTPYVLGYLTQLFYLIPETEEALWYYPHNYAYLELNHSIYNRDIVIELTPTYDLYSNFNELLVFNGWDYQDYLNKLLKAAVPGNTTLQNELRALSNVSAKINGCLKTCPILLKIPYINPSLEVENPSNKVLIDSIYTDIPEMSSQSFTNKVIYGYDKISKSFKDVASLTVLYSVNNYSSNLTASLSDNLSTFNIDSTRRLLTISDKYLSFTQAPAPNGGTYMVWTHEAGGNGSGHASGGLSGYRYGVNYY